MIRQQIFKWVLTVTAILTATAAANAQYGRGGMPAAANGSVSTTGVSVIKRQPDALRMQVELSAKGKTIKEALAKLKTQRDAALARIAKMDAEKDTIKASDPKVGPALTDRQRQMNTMVRQRMRQTGKKSKKAPEAPPVALATTITAEWKLVGADAEARLLESHALEEKIRAADLAGTKDKDADAASPEDEEADEEMNQMMAQDYDDPNQPKAGEPLFIYVAKLSKAEQSKAYAAAFADAKAQAERLSKAAGAELGPLHGLSSSSTPMGMGNYGYQGGYNRYAQQMIQQIYMERVESGAEEAPGEAVGAQVQEVSVAISVAAQFGLGEPAAAKPAK